MTSPNGGDPIQGAEEALDGGARPYSVVRRFAEGARSHGRLQELDTLLHQYDQATGRMALYDWMLENAPERHNGFWGDVPELPPTAEEILQEPGAFDPPERVVSKMAWREHTTLFAAREKVGKSSLWAAATASVTQGFDLWTGLPLPAGNSRVLVVAAEEHPHHVARRLRTFGADLESVRVESRFTADPHERLRQVVDDWNPTLVVVDTVARLFTALPFEVDFNSAADVTRAVEPLEMLARDSGAALALLHHANRHNGEYRGSTALGASVDAILEMGQGDDASTRKVGVKARWMVPDFTYALLGTEESPRFELVDGQLPLNTRVLAFVHRNPGASKTAVREGVTGKASEIDRELGRLTGKEIERREEGSRHAYYPAQDPMGHATDTEGRVSGHASTGNGGVKRVPGGERETTSLSPGTRSPEPVDSDAEAL